MLTNLNTLLKKLNIDRWEIKSTYQFPELWNEYQTFASLRYTIIRISFLLTLSVILLSLVWLFSYHLESMAFIRKEFEHIFSGPFRGSFNLFWNRAIALAAGIFYLILILYVIDSVHLSSHFIRQLAKKLEKNEIIWPPQLIGTYQNKYGLIDRKVIGCKILLDFIKQDTDAPNRFIYYPFFVLFLLILSRNYYFDNWQTTPFILAVYIVLMLFTLASAFRLKAAAVFARKEILKQLESNSIDAPINQKWYKEKDNAAKLKSLIHEIREFKEGIYKPWSQHPVVLYLLLPISSLASIYLIEYLN